MAATLEGSDQIRLPKQWRRWCQKAQLRVHGRYGRRPHEWFYLKGRGRVWRVNCYGAFQCGDRIADFDRWALCHIKEVQAIPKTEREFVLAVRELIARHAWESA